ncbi:NAD(P)-dependent oxidoreductase [Catenuloplanes atrovinosus]|uniref:3-hydroxyisobutyrate dehydrogenase n=1 Tax=Catenuloplanes atrovinosus TaxID=137266 RepID=A0AAE3YJQ9_9ACTN|nr:NAD(P)-dependent oxidoreductase [Catenuloplanes atrovinosus]MDR7274177.1 3-hydroxyisobutyrate dehydrogenase [Catenuloplanes atrovinosus]
MTTVGFVGLGTMGQPMALNLVRAGTDLVVWNRTASRAEPLREAGAHVAATAAEVFTRAGVIVLMLANAAAADAVLEDADVAGRTVVHMGTISPEDSLRLRSAVHAGGGTYVEAPVSGSRVPAEKGELVAMVAGEPDAIGTVRPVLAPMCREIIVCGPVPDALTMKLATNIFMLSSVMGLVEAFHFAARNNLDLATLRAIVDDSQMTSDISRVKSPKLVDRDFSIQGGAADVLKNLSLVAGAARTAGVSVPLTETMHRLMEETVVLGHGSQDFTAALHALEFRDA